MTPSFALNLSEDGIELLHRDPNGPGWVHVSHVGLDDGFLAKALIGLRDKAIELGGEDFSTKLILPPSQLLYATIPVDGDIKTAVVDALADRTPYTVDQLSYDISGEAPEIQIVAVARDTIEEACEFLAPYALNPVGFTAIPEDGQFPREPNLGAWPGSDGFASGGAPVQIVSDYVPAPETEADEVAAYIQPSTLARPGSFASRRRPESRVLRAEEGERIARYAARIAMAKQEQTEAATSPPPSDIAKPDETTKPTPVIASASEKKTAPIIPAPTATPQVAKPASPVATKSGDPIAALAAKQAADRKPLAGTLRIAAVLTAFAALGTAGYYALQHGGSEQVAEAPTPLEPAATENTSETELASLPTEPSVIAEPPAPVFETEPEEETIVEEPAPEIAPAPEPEPVPVVTFTEIDPQEAQTLYAATGIWLKAPEIDPEQIAGTLDDLYVASIDPEVELQDPTALPPLGKAVAEVLMASLPSPPPAGTTYDLDENGWVIPTPEGAFTSDGVPVFAGAPAVLPIPRSAANGPPAPEAAPAPPVEARIANIRPVQRPDELLSERERAELGGYSRAELVAIRPQIRPPSAQAQAEAIAQIVAEAQAENAAALQQSSLLPQVENTAVGRVEDAIPAEILALAVHRPEQRPANFQRVVSRAQARAAAAAQRAAASTAAPRNTSAAVAAPSRATPTAPTQASVARAATDNNAIALGKMALVGVFGTSNNRSALLRLPSGRVRKVSVGDRINGGTVAAIGDGVLKYLKGGRTQTLEMPSG